MIQWDWACSVEHKIGKLIFDILILVCNIAQVVES